ncbi:hypothetical protein [Nocardia sp. NPDC049707]|uniref:DUF6973 domain-containing protein n=1 Tax=Nocardia sp. NPDC049707 TaxID=3154735 RepID=UPI003436DF48
MSWVPPTKTQIRSWTFDALTSQVGEWGQDAQQITEQRAVVSEQLADSPGFWRGGAGDSMRWKGDEAKSSLSKVVSAFDNAQQSTSQIIASLSFAKSAAVNAIQDAEAARFTVADDGAVSFSEDVLAWIAKENDIGNQMLVRMVATRVAKQYEDKIKKCLREAGDAAGSAREAIEKLFAEVPVPLGSDLESIVTSYQVDDGDKRYVMWPDADKIAQWKKWSLRTIDIEPKQITAAEAEMLNNLSLWEQWQFKQISEKAQEEAYKAFPPIQMLDPEGKPVMNDQDNHTDAFRHVYWNALLTREFGEDWTKEYTSKHEMRDDNRSVREAMDLYNNEVGRRLAVENPTKSGYSPFGHDLTDVVKEAVLRGDTVLIDKDGQLNWTNQVKIGEAVNSAAFDKRPDSRLPGAPVAEK